MKLTMPHLGNTYLAAKALFDGMGIDFIVPEFSNREALEIGSKYAPDEICLPFKIMFGNIIQGYKAGADTLLRRIGKISEASNKSRNEQIRALFNAYKVIKLIDYIEGTARYLAGYEVEKGQFKKLLQNCKKDAGKCDDPIKMIEVLEKYKRNLKHIKIDKDKDPIRIAIIGEIYTILEPFANLYIEDKLMDYGISVKKGITPSWWIKDAALVPLKANSISIRRASKEYLPLYVGGHARECIGETVLAEKNNMDGVIQIFPLGCMPEIVAKAILPQISKDKNFPIMSLVVDEMTGEAGYATRIEAFIDLLERRKEKCII
ncbi:acyl-CoA dehydratase activase-related protein [Clostridium sp.]|uniref:acyl-CoA dehydratase activase-related protein n=1 Tax=Clostridium sp. TaxID=1506 RepID=UPI00258ED4B0|nr:acyl-CoA dehydratase activase-related protein [Clostridium sp.]MDF2504807.1 hypothetical protein [Clostridium sp.]